MRKLNLNQAQNARLSDVAGMHADVAGRYPGVLGSLAESERALTWGSVSFNRTDGCAEVTINRHVTGEDAKDLEQVLRSFFDALEERRNIEKEAAYRQQMQAEEVFAKEMAKQPRA